MRQLYKFSVLCILILPVFHTNNVNGQSNNDFNDHVRTIARMRGEVQQNTFKLLVLLRQLDQPAEEKVTRVKIIKTDAVVRETNNASARNIFTARYNEEYDQTEKIDNWYHVALPDGRDGWIEEQFVQTITVLRKRVKASDAQMEAAMSDIVGGLNEKIQGTADSAFAVFREAGEEYGKLSATEKAAMQQSYRTLQQDRDKLTEFSEYARHFTAKYATRQRQSPTTSAMQFPGPMYGQLGLQLGNSAYNTSYSADTKSSNSARTVFFNGGMSLSEQAQATVQLNHQRTIIQTPFTSNDIRLGFDYALSPQSSINSYGRFGGYRDDLSPRNNYNLLGFGTKVSSPLGMAALLTADLSYDGKSYDDEAGNSYNGLQLLSGVKLHAGRQTDWTIGLNGTLQDSKISYLKFNRVAPSLQYATRSSTSSFGVKAEAEHLSYSGDSKGNNFLREQLDLIWSNETMQRQFTVTGKQFPNNDMQNYVRMLVQARTQTREKDSYSSASYSALFNYFTTSSGAQSHYLDVRSDAASVGPVVTQDWNFFGRAWFDSKDTTDRDHMIDAYTRIGFQISSVNIGPVLGAHLQMRKGEKILLRDGNSLRAGIDARSNFTFANAQVSLSARYEKDFVYGRKIIIDRTTGITEFGELVERHPITFQFTLDARYPVLPSLDLTLSINRYEVLPDVNDELSIDPIARRYQFNALFGVNYRFGAR